ncbi:MAG: coenzyme F420-0:L-glutamate ligase [Chloroflexia bacterium]|nr:coenzyme F420-0:L-glutamate ligase [Chloroflexia bacterium]
MPAEVRVVGLDGIPEVQPGDDLIAMIGDAIEASDTGLVDGDIVIITHKIVSKSEGQLVDLNTIEPSALALTFSRRWNKDPRQTEVVLRESVRILRMERGVMICETRHGFICANAGVDASNVPGDDSVCLLPAHPDDSAATIRDGLTARFGTAPAVIITDSFGRPWRRGITNVAIGVAGMLPIADYRGTTDAWGHDLRVTIMAIADELASTAELVAGKTDARPVAIVRGYAYPRGHGSARDLILEPDKDLFR